MDENPYQPSQVITASPAPAATAVQLPEQPYEERPHLLLLLAGWICMLLAIFVLAIPVLAAVFGR